MFYKYIFIFFGAATLFQIDLSATENVSISDAVKNGSANYNFRYRIEHVDQNSFNENALASTLKARINYKTGSYKGFSIFTELDSVIAIGKEKYNSGAGTSGPERAMYPVVADPDGTEINQAYLSYSGFDDSKFKLGRQRILLDNQRFVGGVGWRQNEQTYDAFSVNKNFSSVDLFYAYIGNVNRIFGESVAAGDHSTRSHILNLSRKFSPGKFSGYYYSIDNKDAMAFSTDTIGLRWSGKALFSNPSLSYGLEYALQSDNSNNPLNYTADYYRLDAAYQAEPAKIYLGYEVLEGDASNTGAAFRTPMATLHAFNGWADQFLATPNEGLEDLFLGASGELEKFIWKIKYHDFSVNDGNGDFGNELDFSFGRKFAENYSILFKYADFDSDSLNYSDTSKVWLMLQANF